MATPDTNTRSFAQADVQAGAQASGRLEPEAWPDAWLNDNELRIDRSAFDHEFGAHLHDVPPTGFTS